MNVIPPLTINDARLTSSTIAEPDTGEIAWVSGTTYAVGDVRIVVAQHRKYERLIAGAGTVSPELDTTNWLDVGPTNKWAMFDLLRDTKSIAATPLTVVLTPGERVDSLTILGMVANTAQIDITSGGTNVYSRTVDLDTREVFDWYDYFFARFSTQPSIALFDLPPFTNAIITIALTATSGNVECGACVIGSKLYIGEVQYSAENDVLNFSTVARDFAGATSKLIQRRNVPKTIQQIFIDKTRINAVRDMRDALNALPAVWSALDDNTDGYFEALLILGFYKRFSINLSHPTSAIISLELEEI